MNLGQLAQGGRVDGQDLLDLRNAAAALAVALLALNALDIVVTKLSIASLGAIEVNPVMAPLVGTPWATVLKLGIPIGVFALATRIGSSRTVGVLRVAVAFYMVVAIIGVSQLVYVLA
jgi:hypothetical protein